MWHDKALYKSTDTVLYRQTERTAISVSRFVSQIVTTVDNLPPSRLTLRSITRTAAIIVLTGATLAGADTSCRRVSVCLSVRLSQVGVLLKRLNVGSRKQRHTIAHGI